MELNDLRDQIDQIDQALLPLLLHRMELSKQVAQVKAEKGLPVFHQAREEEILAKVGAQSGSFALPAQLIFSSLMDISRALQHQSLGTGDHLRRQLEKAPRQHPLTAHRIACQGVDGAFSSLAGQKLFPQAETVFCDNFEDVFAAVQNEEVEYGIIPIENSYAGSVHESYDLMIKYQLHIAAGITLPIHHHLMALPGVKLEEIREVYSHPQALAQCEAFLQQQGLTAIPYPNTAAAAQMVAQSGNRQIAAIASSASAKLYGLELLQRRISVSNSNSTRFIAITKKLEISSRADKISLLFSLPHTTGSLYRILARFAICGLNLTKIESRPIPNHNFQYLFYLDFTGNTANPSTQDLLCALCDELPQFTFLGNYHETVLREDCISF